MASIDMSFIINSINGAFVALNTNQQSKKSVDSTEQVISAKYQTLQSYEGKGMLIRNLPLISVVLKKNVLVHQVKYYASNTINL